MPQIFNHLLNLCKWSAAVLALLLLLPALQQLLVVAKLPTRGTLPDAVLRRGGVFRPVVVVV